MLGRRESNDVMGNFEMQFGSPRGHEPTELVKRRVVALATEQAGIVDESDMGRVRRRPNLAA
jgi:hypothetical protein